jgi:hypothetical protein
MAQVGLARTLREEFGRSLSDLHKGELLEFSWNFDSQIFTYESLHVLDRIHVCKSIRMSGNIEKIEHFNH